MRTHAAKRGSSIHAPEKKNPMSEVTFIRIAVIPISAVKNTDANRKRTIIASVVAHRLGKRDANSL
jgi:hypothetical protein